MLVYYMYVCCIVIKKLLSYLAYVYTSVLVHGLVQRVIISMSKLCSLAYSLPNQTCYGAKSLHTLILKINLICKHTRTSI